MDVLDKSVSERIQGKRWVFFFLAVTLFAFPLSSSGKSIFLSLAVITILLIPDFRSDLLLTYKTPWSIAAGLLFFIVVLACFWSPANKTDLFFAIERYLKLLYLPILVVGFQSLKSRKTGLNCFLAAMFITALLSTLKYYGFLNFLPFDSDYVFRNHIMTGLMGAFAAYLSLLFCYEQKGYSRFIYLGLALLFSYHILFINGGRTGYIIYLLLILGLLVQLCNLRQAIAGLIIIAFLFVAAYYSSPVMRGRIASIPVQLSHYQTSDKNTEIGYRLQFHQYAYKLFAKHPLLGNGTGSFTYYFDLERPVPSWPGRLWEPHSQYWLMLSEYGIVGLLALLWFFAVLIKAALQLRQMRPVAIGMLLLFIVGNLSDSLLFYSGTGYFFILVISLCLGEFLEQKKLSFHNCQG